MALFPTHATEKPVSLWAIVELMGHKRVVGRVSEMTFCGATMMQLDVPAENGAFELPQLISPSAIYRVSFTSEEAARRELEWARPKPAGALPAHDEEPPDDGPESSPPDDDDIQF